MMFSRCTRWSSRGMLLLASGTSALLSLPALPHDADTKAVRIVLGFVGISMGLFFVAVAVRRSIRERDRLTETIRWQEKWLAKVKELIDSGNFVAAECKINDFRINWAFNNCDYFDWSNRDKFDFDLKRLNLERMKYLDQALNGQGKKKEADEVARKIQSHWRSYERDLWVARGRPHQGSVHTRSVVINGDYRVVAKQYYQPESSVDVEDPSIVAIYKFVATDASTDSVRGFKLIKTSTASTPVLREYLSSSNGEHSRDVRSYPGPTLPDIRLVASDVASVTVPVGVGARETASVNKLLYSSKFSEAEQLVRSLAAGSQEEGFDIDLMKLLDQALNGQGKYEEANRVADQIKEHWQIHLRPPWIGRGRPQKGSAHTRLILNDELEEYRVFGKQYFEPESIDDEGYMHAVLKFVASPKESSTATPTNKETKRGVRMFKLVRSSNSTILREYLQDGTHKDVSSFQNPLPDIHETGREVIDCLRLEEGKNQGHAEKPYLQGEDSSSACKTASADSSESTLDPADYTIDLAAMFSIGHGHEGIV